jgi:magnesium-transporting ATPase (P-type)
MNVWVLTGDKLETAINIGMACNLLESSMERKGNLLRIDGEDQESVKRQVDSHVSHIRWLREEKHSQEPCGLVITSGAFTALMHSERELLNKFLWVATRCKSVVGCRMQPNQKAKIVHLVKTTQQVTTLAIGDGANDEQMIREADVGVGIRGVEGTTAVRASDYAISQFHFLRRLLFVHGRLNYRRVATLISYIFYKNTLICFITLWFGFCSGFSGQPLFLTWAYQAYNIIYTAIPILAFAVFDRDIPMRTLHREPRIYTLSQHGELFNVIIFWKWILLGLIHSLVIFYIPYLCYSDVAMDNSGQSYGLWELGVVFYTVIVLVVNLKIAMLSCSWTILHHITIWGSIIAYFVTMFLFGASSVFSNAGADYTGMIVRLFGTPRFWFTVTVTLLIALYIDYLMFALHELDIAKKLLPAQLEKWLLETFPTSRPPDPAYIPDPATLPKPKQGALPAERSHAASKDGEQEQKNGPGSSHMASQAKLQRGHTGFDFDYTPREASRLERRSSRSKSRVSEGGTGTPRAPGSPSKVVPFGLEGEA